MILPSGRGRTYTRGSVFWKGIKSVKFIRYLAVSGFLAVATQAQAMEVQGVIAEALSSSAVRVSWEPAEDTDYYDLYQDSQRIQTGIMDTSVDVDGLSVATAFQFFVTACTSDGRCSAASSQANVETPFDDASSGVCEVAEDGVQPQVVLTDLGDNAAVLSWCEVVGAEGYNLFVGNQYESTFGAGTFTTTVSYTGTEEYQIGWYADGFYAPKSAVAVLTGSPIDSDPTPVKQTLASIDAATNQNDNDVEIYFTRHAEKMTQLAEQADGSFIEACGESKCAEVLNAKGELRAELLAMQFDEAGITERLTNAFSSHKIRTRQTIEQITADAGLSGDMDKNADDGIQEFPISNDEGSADAAELDPESTSPSKAPVIEALLSLPAGSVALVAGHSGTLYDIMAGIGLSDVCLEDTVDICNQDRYPIDEDVKVKNFGDIWKVTLQDGVASFAYRVNLQPVELAVDELAQ